MHKNQRNTECPQWLSDAASAPYPHIQPNLTPRASPQVKSVEADINANADHTQLPKPPCCAKLAAT